MRNEKLREPEREIGRGGLIAYERDELNMTYISKQTIASIGGK